MSKNKAYMNKFLTGAVTAAMVSTAITPVAAADNEIEFSDVDASSSHYPNIIQAAERGLMTGFEGKFNPLQDMTRGQVVKSLGKYIITQKGMSLDKYVEEKDLINKTTPFNDVPADATDQELYKYSLVVKDAGVFTGDQNNLHATNKIRREQMAKVLVNAFDLQAIDGEEVNIADLETIQTQYVDDVKILAQHNITVAEDHKYRPKGNVTRQQMASFLNRSYDVVHEDVEEDDELVVTSVNATTNYIKNKAEQTLKFSINENKEMSIIDLAEAGYTVKFEYNKTGAQYDENGTVNGTTAADKFEYRVIVTPEEGDAITSSWKKVETVDASVITKVTKVGLVEVGTESDWTQTVLDGQVTFDAVEFENILGEKNTDENNPFGNEKPTISSAVSSDIATAYYDNGKIFVVKDGQVTFNIKFEGIEETVKVTVNVKTEQTPSSIEAVSKNIAVDEESTVTFNVLDQDEEQYFGQDKVFVSTKVADQEESAAEEIGLTKGVGQLKKTFALGANTIIVYTDAEKTTKLGEFVINAVDTNKNPDQYTLTLQDDQQTELDLNDVNKTVKLDAKAFVEEVNVPLPEEQDYKIDVTSSNEHIKAELNNGVVTVKINDASQVKANDQATIQLVLKEGSKETKVGNAITINIKNTTKQIDSMTLKDKTKVVVNKGASQEELKAAVVEAIVEGVVQNPVTAAMIEKVVYVPSNKQVLVQVKENHGGKMFTLAADYFEHATLKNATFDNSVAALTLTFSEAVTAGETVSLKINDETIATTAVEVNESDKTAKLTVDTTIDLAASTIKAIEGLSTANGNVIVPTDGTVITSN